MPNRCSILTGRLPSAHRVISNDRSLAPNSRTFARALREASYRTALVGKSHIQHGMSRGSRRAATLASPLGDPFEPAGTPGRIRTATSMPS